MATYRKVGAPIALAFATGMLAACGPNTEPYRQQVGIDAWNNPVALNVWTKPGRAFQADRDALALPTRPGEPPKVGSMGYTDGEAMASAKAFALVGGTVAQAVSATGTLELGLAERELAKASARATGTSSQTPVTVNVDQTQTNTQKGGNVDATISPEIKTGGATAYTGNQTQNLSGASSSGWSSTAPSP